MIKNISYIPSVLLDTCIKIKRKWIINILKTLQFDKLILQFMHISPFKMSEVQLDLKIEQNKSYLHYFYSFLQSLCLHQTIYDGIFIYFDFRLFTSNMTGFFFFLSGLSDNKNLEQPFLTLIVSFTFLDNALDNRLNIKIISNDFKF